MLKILFLTADLAPFGRLGKQGSLAAALPRALKKIGHEVRVVTPRYGCIKERKYGLRDVARLREMQITMGGREYLTSVKSGFVENSKVQVYFVENSDCIPREPDEFNTGEADIYLAMGLLAHTSLNLIEYLNWTPDIMYCLGWSTATASQLLRSHNSFKDRLRSVKVVFHPMGESEKQPVEVKRLKALGIEGLKARRTVRLEEIGREYADMTITPGGTGDEWLEFLSKGSEAHLTHANKTSSGNRDHSDAAPARALKKAAFQKAMGLPVLADTPLVAVWSAKHCAGVEQMLMQIESELPSLPVQLIALGGNDMLQHFVNRWVEQHSDKVASLNGMDASSFTSYESAVDIVLMTERDGSADPCHAENLLMKALPITHHWPGDPAVIHGSNGLLADSSQDQPNHDDGLIAALKLAVDAYSDPVGWEELQRKGLCIEYCFEQAARRLTTNFMTMLNK